MFVILYWLYNVIVIIISLVKGKLYLVSYFKKYSKKNKID